MKMKLFPATLRDRAKDWYLKLGKEFTSWTEMEEEFLRKYYSVGKTTFVRKAIREFTQGSSETFHETWERLRDLTRECPHHGVSNREITQIFYDGLGPQDRFLLDAASCGTFMSKYEDDAMDFIETVAENSHHNAAKPFGRGAMPKALDTKSAETRMLLERIDKWQKSRTYYWTDSTSAMVPKDSPPSHSKRHHHAQLARDSTTSN